MESDSDERVICHLRVEGMMCQKSCGSTVENALSSLSFVRSASASYAKSYAEVNINLKSACRALQKERGVTREALKEAVEEELVECVECVGFDCTVLSEAEAAAVLARDDGNDGNDSNDSNDKQLKEEDAVFSSSAPEISSGPVGASCMLSVSGMSCAVCAQKVERAIRQVYGDRGNDSGNDNNNNKSGFALGEVAVNFATGRTKLSFYPTSQSQQELSPEVLQPFVQDCVEHVVRIGYQCQILSISSSNNGMSLQQNATRMEATRLEELHSWRSRLLLSVALTIPIMLLHMTAPAHHSMNSPTLRSYTLFFLATLVQTIVGSKFYTAAYKGLRYGGGMLGMDALVVMGTTAAYLYSVIVFFLHLSCTRNSMPPLCQNVSAMSPTFETAAMLLTFVTLGKYMEAHARGKTAMALQKLMSLQPSLAQRILCDEATKELLLQGMKAYQQAKDQGLHDNDETISHSLPRVNLTTLPTEQVSTEDIQVGDLLLVIPGARIPTDGTVLASESTHTTHANTNTSNNNNNNSTACYVDESMLTGEPFPVPKYPSSQVYGSCVNQLNVMAIQVHATGGQTVLARIVQLMEDAQASKAPIQAQADKIAAVFVPCVMMLSFVTFAGWMYFAGSHAHPMNAQGDNDHGVFFKALMSAISVLVVACPCALGLATPTAVMVGTGVGAQNGLLIKGGAVLESAYAVDTVVFDKTGTLTTGRAVLGNKVEYTAQYPFADLYHNCPTALKKLQQQQRQQQVALWLAACAEMGSEHPLSRAIVNAARQQWGSDVTCTRSDSVQVSHFQMVPGEGVQCVVQKHGWGERSVRVGCRRWALPQEEQSQHAAATTNSNSPLLQVQEQNNKTNTPHEEIARLRQMGQIGVYVSLSEGDYTKQSNSSPSYTVIGVLGIVDPLANEAKSTIRALQRMNMDVWMCTGDAEATAYAVGRELNISQDRVCAGVKPQGKADLVTRLQKRARRSGTLRSQGRRKRYGFFRGQQGASSRSLEPLNSQDSDSDLSSNHGDQETGVLGGEQEDSNTQVMHSSSWQDKHQYEKITASKVKKIGNNSTITPSGRVAFVGDGINDSVALARADVGIAVGAGTEVAVEAANIVLVRNSLHDVVVAMNLSRLVFERIKWNFFFALVYNMCALPFAAGVLFPLTGWRLPPAFAGLMMAFSSVSVVTSSLLLRMYSRPVIGEDGVLMRRRGVCGILGGTWLGRLLCCCSRGSCGLCHGKHVLKKDLSLSEKKRSGGFAHSSDDEFELV